MKKKLILILSTTIFITLSFIVLKALSEDNPYEVIDVVELGGFADKGSVDLRVDRSMLLEATSGYKGSVHINVDPGYYVESLEVKLGETVLQLGEETGQGFFRDWDFDIQRMDYEFLIPSEATADNKITVSVKYEEKAPININYYKYTKEEQTESMFFDKTNYAYVGKLVDEYLDGDIVLPTACDNGCILGLQFDNETDYNKYKSYKLGSGESFVNARAVLREEGKEDEDTMFAGDSVCDDENYFCEVYINKNFKKLLVGELYIGYTPLKVYSPYFIGFDVELDVENFTDILFEKGNDVIEFGKDNTEVELELFYGTKVIRLHNHAPRAIVNNDQTNNCPDLPVITNVTGEDFAYTSSYENDTLTININSYYQDKLDLVLSLYNGEEKIFGKDITIKLNRFAFSGNAGELLEVDSEGRNCRESNNGNTCSDGVYYSTQYRGVYSAFYIDKNTTMTRIDAMHLERIDGNTAVLEYRDNAEAYARNKSFNPHALIEFYDENDMIIETKIIDLNDKTMVEGFVSKNTFNTMFEGLDTSRNIDRDFIFIGVGGREIQTKMKDVEYFDNHINGTIMYDMVLIGKDEAREKGVKKISVFLINGEIGVGSTPALTYGTGEGKTFEIRSED